MTEPMYVISPITTYNDDELLFETKVGLNISGMPLLYSVYGRTEDESYSNAKALVVILDLSIVESTII